MTAPTMSVGWEPQSATGTPIQVLHVDDDPEVVDLAVRLLEREDDAITVIPETRASDGLDRLTATDVDCIVSDYQMPGMDGLEFLAAVRGLDAEIPFILFTGQGSEEIASEAISAGVDDYLQKQPGTDQYTILANRIRNLTERSRAERGLQERTRQFETLLSNLPGMAYRCQNDRGWPMEFVSDGCAELTGYPAARLLTGEVSYGHDVIHPDDRDAVWTAVQTAIEDREPFRIEYRILSADGEERWVWEQGRGVYVDGAVGALEGFITDVSERKENERHLEYQASLLEAQMEATIDGLLVVDEDRSVVSYNERFVELWDLPEELVSAGDETALLEWVADHKLEEPAAFSRFVEHLYANPDETSRDRVRLSDGRVFDRYSAPVTGTDGTHYGRLWVFRDVTGDSSGDDA